MKDVGYKFCNNFVQVILLDFLPKLANYYCSLTDSQFFFYPLLQRSSIIKSDLIVNRFLGKPLCAHTEIKIQLRESINTWWKYLSFSQVYISQSEYRI